MKKLNLSSVRGLNSCQLFIAQLIYREGQYPISRVRLRWNGHLQNPRARRALPTAAWQNLMTTMFETLGDMAFKQ